MSIRVLTTRLVMPGREAVLIGLLKKLQAEACVAPGFLASTAFREADSPTTMVVISEWHDVPSWNRWLEKMERHTLLDSMREHLYGPITHKVLLPIRDPEAAPFLL